VFPGVTLLELLQPYLVKVAIDDHILRGDWVGLGPIAGMFLLVLAGLYVLRMTQAYLTQLTGQLVICDLRNAIFAHLQRLDARFFDRNPVGRLMTRVLNDVEAIQLFTSGVVSILGDVLTVVGVVVIMLWMNWELALVTFALVPLLALATGYFRLRARDSYRLVRTRLARLNAFLQESLQGMSVIQLFARERRERALFAGLNADLRRGQFRSTFYDASLYATVEAIGSAAVALLLWYGGGEVARDVLTFGGLVAFLEYTHRFSADPRSGSEVRRDAGGGRLVGAHLRLARHRALDPQWGDVDARGGDDGGLRAGDARRRVPPRVVRVRWRGVGAA
jgi:ATP-binding cassette subfamily B protein